MGASDLSKTADGPDSELQTCETVNYLSFTVDWKAYPSGKMLIICLPIIREELCIMLEGLTQVSETESSESNSTVEKAANQAIIGICKN